MNVDVTIELEINLSVFEIQLGLLGLLGLYVRACVQMYSSCAVPIVQSNKQNGDDLWLLMETNGIGKRDSVLSKIIKS